ncbi:Polycomb group EMBRYONIC FLOWER 2-like protein [Quillaja saponaria]|uniref:Polycomb group EMBRYONIC FLOWER 2-like protein n=2 Tax=Quillaja saponaria TaxID=32244 RepID=A0AAD7Q4P9_QUISA|nr:Polycomb group EMBRYONIC FLOWER 2-like protein [Quillaja saponaria]
MPGIPLVARESSYSRTTDQMCRPDSRVHLSAEEELAAEESLSIYCKPVELYNILQRRAIRNPAFLQRCLQYKIKEKQKKRIQMTVSLSRTMTENQNVFPLFVFLARLVSDVGVAEHSALYRFNQICILTNASGVGGCTEVQANFNLPDFNKLAVEAKSRSLFVLFVSFVGAANSSCGVNATNIPLDLTSFASTVGGYCLWGRIPLESLYNTWENSPNFSLGQRAEIMSTVDMVPCFLKKNYLNEDNCILIQVPCNFETVSTSKQVQITISAEEFGAKERSPYSTYTGGDIPPSSLSHILRLREGNVIFNYRYYNNKLQRTEVTEDFSCPFCLVKCSSFKGLRHHLPSSHDLFNFEFWVTQEYQAVNISVKNDIWRSEVVADDPKVQTFFFCAKPLQRKRSKNLAFKYSKHVHPLVLESNLPAVDTRFLEKADGGIDLPRTGVTDTECVEHAISSFDVGGISSATLQPYADPYGVQPVSGGNSAPPAMLQFSKTRKLSVERSDPRNCALLRKRQFFHSHRAQPMALDQVLSDQDSEDEVDDDVADFEDRRMLDDFVDVTKDEKQMMHMWNSFVRKQRVLADGHIPWACEAFSKLHGPDLVKAPALICCWRLFMIKLWNHGLLDPRTINDCNIILAQCQKQNSDPKS